TRRRSTSSNPRPAMWSRIGARSASTDIGVAGKKMWGNSPTSTVGPTRRPRAESIGSGHAEIGDHPPVRPARGAVTIEGSAIVGTAPRGAGHPGEAQGPGLGREPAAQVQVPGAAARRGHAAPRHDFRSYFIAVPANPYPTMHYNISQRRRCRRDEPLDPGSQNPASRPPPPRMQQGDAPPRDHEID